MEEELKNVTNNLKSLEAQAEKVGGHDTWRGGGEGGGEGGVHAFEFITPFWPILVRTEKFTGLYAVMY